MIKMVDAQLALSVYLRATANQKVIQSFVETQQFDKIMVYCQKVGYTADWGLLLTNIVRVNPQGALDFAQKLAAADGVSLDYGVVADVFMQHNCLQQATSFLLDVLKGDKPEEGPLQTRLLEMNLMAAPQARRPAIAEAGVRRRLSPRPSPRLSPASAPQVADAIMANEMFHHYDRPRIAMLCEKAGLAARALEHYDNVEDMKRAMMRTELIPPEFLVKFFGTLSVENAIECLNHLLRTNMRQNLQTVIQVAREYSEQLGPDKLIEMFPSLDADADRR